MAENTDKEDNTSQPSKRRLRAPSETVRERTAKANQQLADDAAPQKPHPISSFAKGFTWPIRQLGKQIAKLGRFRVVRVIGRVVFPKYFRNSWRELRMVSWPSRRQSWKLTYAVIVFSVLFGAIVAVVDFGLDKLFKELIIK